MNRVFFTALVGLGAFGANITELFSRSGMQALKTEIRLDITLQVYTRSIV